MMRQLDTISRGLRGALALSVILLGLAPAARAALVTITNCASVVPNNLGNVVIDVGTDDLSLECVLTPATGHSSVTLRGHDISIKADLIFPGQPSNDGVAVFATGMLEVIGANIQATNPNGDVRLVAAEGITFNSSSVRTGSNDRFGQDLRVLCTGPRCNVTARQTNFDARRIWFNATGDIYFGLVQVHSHSPRDIIQIISTGGAALMSGCGNLFLSGPEGNMSLVTCKKIDLAFARVLVSENIDILTTGACGGDLDTSIRVTGATVSNDFGKTGNVRINAANQAEVNICGAVIIDDNGDVAEINGREQVPHFPFNNVVGPPDVDE